MRFFLSKKVYWPARNGELPYGNTRNRWCVTPSDPIILPFVYPPLHPSKLNDPLLSYCSRPISDPAGSIKHSRICLFSHHDYSSVEITAQQRECLMMMMMMMIDLVHYATSLCSILPSSSSFLLYLVSYLVYFLDYSCSELTKKGKGGKGTEEGETIALNWLRLSMRRAEMVPRWGN